jgi:hypothetical protein
MKATIQILRNLAARVREIMKYAPANVYDVTPMIRCYGNMVCISTGENKSIPIMPDSIEIPFEALPDLEKWAKLSVEEYNANISRLEQRHNEWIEQRIQENNRIVEQLKNQSR